jgi:Tfp pilus assembly protein PilN
MRAVNLIPAEERKGAGGAAGRSGGAAYILLGAMAALVLMLAAWGLASRQVTHRRSELANVTRSADAAEAKANALASYTQFSALSQTRLSTVTSLAEGRFDWAHVMHEMARVIPSNVWLSSFTGSASGAASGGGGSVPASTSGGPSAQLSGCTTSQKSVVRLMAQLRLIDGVESVDLTSSDKSGSSGGSGGGCSSHDGYPTFAIGISFKPVSSATPAAAAATPSTTGATPSTTGATPAATGSTPAASSAQPTATPAPTGGSGGIASPGTVGSTP